MWAFSQLWHCSNPHGCVLGSTQVLGTTAVTTRALLENPHLIDWGLLPKALMGLLALLCGNGCVLSCQSAHDIWPELGTGQ